ncbi:hypothetical protein ACLBWT_03735 [Paenibacillus sp. D51F]
MIKVRLVPFLTTIAISAALFFGGWYAYDQAVVERPLQSAVDSLPGVVSAVPTLSKDSLTVRLKLGAGADLRGIHDQIADRSAKWLEGRKLVITVDQSSQPKLDSIWTSQLFTVAEAMENRRYSEIPDALKEIERTTPGLKTATSIDDSNVYVTLELGTDTKYVILPRAGERMGVWTNA